MEFFERTRDKFRRVGRARPESRGCARVRSDGLRPLRRAALRDRIRIPRGGAIRPRVKKMTPKKKKIPSWAAGGAAARERVATVRFL